MSITAKLQNAANRITYETLLGKPINKKNWDVLYQAVQEVYGVSDTSPIPTSTLEQVIAFKKQNPKSTVNGSNLQAFITEQAIAINEEHIHGANLALKVFEIINNLEDLTLVRKFCRSEGFGFKQNATYTNQQAVAVLKRAFRYNLRLSKVNKNV